MNAMKILLMIFVFVCETCLSQEYGIPQGLSVKVPYSQMIEEERQQNDALRQAAERFKKRYYDAVELNNSSVDSKTQPSEGWADAIVLCGIRYFEKGSVFIENSVVIKYEDPNGKTHKVTAGGKLTNFKTIVSFGSTNNYEVILAVIMQK